MNPIYINKDENGRLQYLSALLPDNKIPSNVILRKTVLVHISIQLFNNILRVYTLIHRYNVIVFMFWVICLADNRRYIRFDNDRGAVCLDFCIRLSAED